MEGPKVTGLSPREGQPGTRVTLRGERLGRSQQDIVSVTICGMDCTLFTEWKSSSKIVTRSPAAKGKGEVVVVTKSGGRGSSTVFFTAKENEVGPLQGEKGVVIDGWGRERGSGDYAGSSLSNSTVTSIASLMSCEKNYHSLVLEK